MPNDLDYLAARVHGRRSRLAEGDRLDALGRLRTIAQLGRAVFPDADLPTAAEFQRRLVQELVSELSAFIPQTGGGGARLLGWMLVRFQVENLRVLIRGFATRASFELLDRHLVSLPNDLTLDWRTLASADSPGELEQRMPRGPLRQALKIVGTGRDPCRPFFLEAALDRGYLHELVSRAAALSDEDRELVEPVVQQEADNRHLALIGRGKFVYGLEPERLLEFHVAGTKIPHQRFAAMLAEPDLIGVACLAVGRAVDAPPSGLRGTGESLPDAAGLERCGWHRFARLANRAFRRGHVGLGAIVGYVALRRVEVANLITLSEAIRQGIEPDAIRSRYLSQAQLPLAYA